MWKTRILTSIRSWSSPICSHSVIIITIAAIIEPRSQMERVQAMKDGEWLAKKGLKDYLSRFVEIKFDWKCSIFGAWVIELRETAVRNARPLKCPILDRIVLSYNMEAFSVDVVIKLPSCVFKYCQQSYLCNMDRRVKIRQQWTSSGNALSSSHFLCDIAFPSNSLMSTTFITRRDKFSTISPSKSR